MNIYHIVAVLALCIQMLAPYAVWFNRWNIPAHLNLGFCVTAYIVPGLFTSVWQGFSDQMVEIYALMNFLGALSILVGTVLGYRLSLLRWMRPRLQIAGEGAIDEYVYRRVMFWAFVGISLMVVAYIGMGFVPMFAEDPFAAKQFKGEYRDAYYRVAYLFRFGFSLLIAMIPLVFAAWIQCKSRVALVFGAIAVGLITVSLARQSTAIGILAFVGAWTAYKNKFFKSYVTFVAIVFPLGSAAYYLLGIYMGIESMVSVYSVDSIFDIVSSGSPDIWDQMDLLSRFYSVEAFTYGRTILGGLIPGNFEWNPSVWTLTFDNVGGDISETVSGGLRLSSALWGYANFGWFGVFFVPFVSGLLGGSFIAVIRRIDFKKSLLGFVFLVSVCMTLGKQLSEFYMLSIHALPAIFVLYLVSRRPAGRQVAGV
ncbi:MAG: hypothetical protein QM803_14030 [Rhodocyclaceae bacterium]